ncbi:hypothetical protein PILCRDRAFT_829884 [Piloderma croceum F 1598]|uniref:Uncharacterized protein n=1 Tax=Piloderma croceum (strain F 1598) TaxID=765440 RepID=A0A0C3AEP3_PILCF|nr:hypothetical protein PILCRDRAFT_829884 [Piloderma croceum F 1598]
MSSVAALNIHPATVAPFNNFFTAKIMRAVAAAEDPTSNRGNLEAPWYEVYSLFLERLLLSHHRFAVCPQGSLVADIGPQARWRTPDFTLFRYIDQLLANNTIIIHSRMPRLLVEIKRALKRPSAATIGRVFRAPEFITQVRDQAKLAFACHPTLQGIFLLQCVGRFWRRGYITSAGTSPLHNNAGLPVLNVQWRPIVDITTPFSDAQVATDLNNAQGNVFFV